MKKENNIYTVLSQLKKDKNINIKSYENLKKFLYATDFEKFPVLGLDKHNNCYAYYKHKNESLLLSFFINNKIKVFAIKNNEIFEEVLEYNNLMFLLKYKLTL